MARAIEKRLLFNNVV